MRSAEELENALMSIRQARDMVIARNLELSSEITIARDRVAELEDERDDSDRARDSALGLAQELSRENESLRERVAALTDEISKLEAELRTAQEVARTQKSEGDSAAASSPTEFEALRREVAESEAMKQLLKSQHALHSATLSDRLTAAQRARDIAVASVTNAQRQVERLAAERRTLQAQVESERATFEARIAQLESQLEASAGAAQEVEMNPVDPSGSFVTDDGEVTIALIRSCIESLANNPADRATLDELDERLHGCAASASGLGHVGIARFSSACGELTRWLCKTPRKIESTIPTLREAGEILATLFAQGPRQRIADPAGALVYSVDDDGDNCECITMSLEKMALKTRYAMKPETALAELSTTSCDIITLDVDLGTMDGFEVAARIREMERHRYTPIIFLSGLMSTKERIAALSDGPYHFIPKPYNLNELGVIALGTILKSRLANSGDATSSVV